MLSSPLAAPRLVGRKDESSGRVAEHVRAIGEALDPDFKLAGNVRATSAHAATDAAHLFRIRDGKISELREYANTRSVVAAFAPQAALRRELREDALT